MVVSHKNKFLSHFSFLIFSFTYYHTKNDPPKKLVHFILTDWLDQDDMLTAKKALIGLTNRKKEQSSIHQQNEQLRKTGLEPLDVKMIV